MLSLFEGNPMFSRQKQHMEASTHYVTMSHAQGAGVLRL